MTILNFDLNGYKIASPDGRKSLIESYVLKQFAEKFKWKETISREIFNKIVSEDKMVRRWYRDLNAELNKLSQSPDYTILEGVPDAARDIVIQERSEINIFFKDLDLDTQKVVNEYKAKMKALDDRKKKKISEFSLYTLVSTITIDDVPLDMKRKLFIIDDGDKVKLFRKDVVSEYKQICFKNLIDNGGKFSEDFDNPFNAK